MNDETTFQTEDKPTDLDNVEDGNLSNVQLSSEEPVSSFLESREGKDLSWSNVNMILENNKSQTEAKKILDNVWGEVPNKKLTAIMGPSGSGKTSLLNIIAGRARSKNSLKISANIRLNEYKVDPTDIKMRQKIAFVAQDDSLQVTSTPREAIRFSAKLRLPRTISDEEIDKLTNEILHELGLVKCADTYVGGALQKGISGGERKRTSVGVELVTRPAMVFLDEPTSGLDSFNAVQLCQLLKRVCEAGSSVLFTIHQPSSEIFSSFDRLILLNQGRVMYQGPTDNVPNFFETNGYQVPSSYNPADWIMKVAMSNSIDVLNKAGFFPADDRPIVEVKEIEKNKFVLLWGSDDDRTENYSQAPPGPYTQVSLLFQRELKNLVRNIPMLKTRMGMTTMMSLLSGCLFYQVAKTDFTTFINIQSTFGALLMSLMSNIFATAMPSLLAMPSERPVFLREYSTNHYSVLAYSTSKLTIEAIMTAVQVTVSSLITFNMIGFSINYGVFWSGLFIMGLASGAIGVAIGSMATNPETATEFLPAVIAPQILFAGFFVPPELMPVWLSWLRYIMPLTYATHIVLAGEFGHGRCDGLKPNNCEPMLSKVEAEVDDTLRNHLILICLFVFIRSLGLIFLKKKATVFY